MASEANGTALLFRILKSQQLFWLVTLVVGLVLLITSVTIAAEAVAPATAPDRPAEIAPSKPYAFNLSVTSAPMCPANITAYWKLDETSGTVYDDSQDNHDGSRAGTCPTPTTGQVNGAQLFDGSNTGVNVPADIAFNWGANDSFSIEFWMKGVAGQTCADSGASNNEVMIGRDDGPTALHWWLGCANSSGNAHFQLEDISGTGASLSGPPINDGNWHHIVGVRDGTNNMNRLYVDATEVASTTVTYSASFSSTSAAINLGWLNLSSGFHFTGTLDEVAIYSRSLLSTEVQQHYDNGLLGEGYCAAPPTITSTPVTETIVGQPYTYNVEASGYPTPTYSLTTKPNGMTIDPDTGVISWTPNLGQAGSHPVEVNASNTVGNVTQTFIIDVFNPAIAIAKSPDFQTVVQGETASFSVAITNTGDVTLTLIVDDPFGDANCQTPPTNPLLAGATTAYNCTATNTTTDFTNVITATGTFTPTSGAPIIATATDSAFVDVLPGIILGQVVEGDTQPEPGGLITSSLTLTNTSGEDVTLTSLTNNTFGDLTDPGNPALSSTTCTTGANVAANEGTYTCSFSGEFLEQPGNYTLSTTATAEDDEGNEATDSDDTTITIEESETFLYLPVILNN